MTTTAPFAAFKIMTFDVVGTLIDFEGGMLTYLRKSGAAPSDVSDYAILDAYRASRTAGKTLRYPDDLVRAYFDLAQSRYHDIGIAKALGYRTCWIERRKGREGFGGTIAVERLTTPDFHFATLGELAGKAV